MKIGFCCSLALLLIGPSARADLGNLVRACILGMDAESIEAAEACTKAEGAKEAKAELQKDAKSEAKSDSDDDDVDIPCTPLSVLMGPTLSKTRVSGGSDTVITMTCTGDQAKELYEALKYYAHEVGPEEDDTHMKYLSRFFGDLKVPSQCVRYFQAANGSSMELYSCFIGIDLKSAIVKAW